jgi:hypothetical protein
MLAEKRPPPIIHVFYTLCGNNASEHVHAFIHRYTRSNRLAVDEHMIRTWSVLKDSVRTAKKTQLVSITTVSWLTLFKETIPVYCENHAKHIIPSVATNSELLNVKVGGAYRYHSVLKCLVYKCVNWSVI